MSEPESAPKSDLDARVEAIESGYEFLLAYAAQGRDTDRGAGAGRNVREFLESMEKALDGVGTTVRTCFVERGGDDAAVGAAFLDAVERDAETARAAVRLVLAQPDISSQLIDNLNASIHLRALLTDLFLVDEALKVGRR
ncbi:MAG: hypothetical protein JXB36_09800 [Gammaproteobacteria bacterium]|nr:hypothetical protein [Gammaproteobacteria bacterium]